MLKKEKLYIILLSILIISQIGGLYGGALVPTRFFTICFCFFMFANSFFAFIGRKDQFLLQFSLFNIIYCFVLILLYNANTKINEYIYYFINMLLTLEILYFSTYIERKYETFWMAWVIFVSLTIPVALYEIISNVHLPVAYQQENYLLKGVGIEKKFASVTFGNYNLYNNILVFAMPIILSKILTSVSKKAKVIALSVALICLSIVAINGSRGSLLSLFVSFLFVFCFYFYKNKSKAIKIAKLVVFLIPAAILLIYQLYINNVFTLLLYRIENQGFEDDKRSRLIDAGLLMAEKSNLIGIGAGNFVDESKKMNLGLGELPAHNLFIEILSEYGLLILLIFLCFLYKIFKNVSKVDYHIKYILYTALFTLPINFVINSGYLNVVYMWVYFSTLYVLSNYTKRRLS